VRFPSKTPPARFLEMTAALSATGMLALAVLGSGARATQAREAALPLDHFTCYPATFGIFKVRKVGLADQFGKSVAVVSQPLRLCSPVSKNGQALVNPRAHLVCYPITRTPQFQVRKVLVKNQFGSQAMTVVRPETLCLPSSKATTGTPGPVPTTLDHYTCYTVDPSGTFTQRVVKLADQFGTSRDTVLTPVSLCAPTRKRGSVLVHARLHLTCYRIKSVTRARRVVIRNQFGLLKGLPTLRQLLCLPSTKTVQG
jgi:hypothetical protein